MIEGLDKRILSQENNGNSLHFQLNLMIKYATRAPILKAARCLLPARQLINFN